MINLAASQLTVKLTFSEKENIKSMSLLKNYEKALKEAKELKEMYLQAKEFVKTNGESEKANNSHVQYFKNEALEYWNKSQNLLAEYNKFQETRKHGR